MRRPRRLLLLLPVLEFGCAGPDEFSLATYGGQTDYQHQTDIWDSNNWGAEARLSWDIGERQQANRAMVQLHEELARRERLRPEPEGKPVKVETESNIAEIISAIVVLVGAIASYFQRHNIGKGVKHIASRVTRKKETPK